MYIVTQQDYLDNLVWVYYRIKRFSLIGYEDLLLNIEQEYNKYFRLIYGDAVSDEFFEAVIREAGKYFQRSNERVSKGYSIQLSTLESLNTIRHGNYAEMIRNVIKMDILKIQKISPNGNASL